MAILHCDIILINVYQVTCIINCSVFFTRALLGLIVSIVWYLLMFMVISLVGSGDSLVPVATYWGASISSHAGLSFSFDTMVAFEA